MYHVPAAPTRGPAMPLPAFSFGRARLADVAGAVDSILNEIDQHRRIVPRMDVEKQAQAFETAATNLRRADRAYRELVGLGLYPRADADAALEKFNKQSIDELYRLLQR